MGDEEALKVIQALADGVNPITGEVLPDNSPYQSAEIVRALHASIKAIEHKIKSDARRNSLPRNAGKPWSGEEDYQVAKAFDEGVSVTEIAHSHMRTRGAIQSRLVKLGKIELRPDFEGDAKNTPQNSTVEPLESEETYASNSPRSEHECIECGAEIPKARLKAIPGVQRCVSCEENLETRDPSIIERKVDEGLSGSREDNKRMRNKQYSDMRRRDYE